MSLLWLINLMPIRKGGMDKGRGGSDFEVVWLEFRVALGTDWTGPVVWGVTGRGLGF